MTLGSLKKSHLLLPTLNTYQQGGTELLSACFDQEGMASKSIYSHLGASWQSYIPCFLCFLVKVSYISLRSSVRFLGLLQEQNGQMHIDSLNEEAIKCLICKERVLSQF